MSFNKNIKTLKALEVTIPKKNIPSFKKLFKLYESKFFTNFITAKNLALKLSSRGQGQTNAVKKIDELWAEYLELIKSKKTNFLANLIYQLDQLLNNEITNLTIQKSDFNDIITLTDLITWIKRKSKTFIITESNDKIIITIPRIAPESVSTIKISINENLDFKLITHVIQLKKMIKAIPNALYMQTVKYYDESKKEITNDNIFRSWKWIGTKQQLTKEAILAINMANTKGGSETEWKPIDWAYNTSGYCIIKTYAFKNISDEEISNAYPTEEQTFAANDSDSCVYDGLLAYFKSKSKDRNAKANYNKLVANESIYKRPFKESELASLGEFVKSSIVIKDLVNGNDKIYNENQFNIFRIEFINSRYNHLELYLNSHKEPLKITESEYNDIKESSDFYVERYGTLSTITNNYKIVDTSFKTLFKKWKVENKFNTLSINYNDDTYKLLQFYDFGMHRFFNNFEIDDSLYREYDLKKAYFNYSNKDINKHYKGVPSGAFINCSCDNWTIDTFNTITSNNLIGFYQVEIIKSSISDKLGFIVGSNHVLATSMINLLKSYVEFKFINASYAPMVHIPFTDEFLNKENDIKHYCKAFGHMLITSTTSNTDIKINQEDLKYYSIIKKDNCKYYSNKNIIHMTEPIENAQSHIHIAYTIHAYTQTLVLEEILKHNIDDIFGVKLDSIVFKKSVKLIETNNWSIKEGKIESLLNRSFYQDPIKDPTVYKMYKNYLDISKPEFKKIDLDIDDDEPQYKGEKITRSNLDYNIEEYEDQDEAPKQEPPIYIIEKEIYDSKTNYKIASKPDIKFKQIMTQNNIAITSRVVFIGGKGGSGKTHSLLNFFDQNKLCYTTMCWNLIQGKKQDYKNIIGLSINKLTGKVNGKACEKTSSSSIRIIVIDEATLLNESDIKLIIDEYHYAYIFILGDVEQSGFYYQCSNQNKVINPSSIKNLQYIEYTKSYRFDDNLNKKLDDLRTFMKITQDQYKIVKIKKYIESNFSLCFRPKESITYNNEDIGICATDDYKKDNSLTKYFTDKGTIPKYFIKTTNIYKGQLRGQELISKPDHSNYEEKLFKTIHSFQGLDLNHKNKIIISVDKCFDYNLYYTAISRARRLDQIIFI